MNWSTKRLRIAVIIDGGTVEKLAADALDAIEGAAEIAVFSCSNTRRRRHPLKHAAYYALNLVTVRNRFTRRVNLKQSEKTLRPMVIFNSRYEGAWQVLPEDIVDALAGFDVILKFGMGLLRVPPIERLPVPILSYHHGDPDKYRGRPAGFWEIASGEPAMGQVVQVIENRLDAGRVVAYAETKVFPWSYRATLKESYRHSALIINQAIRNSLDGVSLAKTRNGRNFRLPTNFTVVKFVARMAAKYAARMAYGAFLQKCWRVSIAPSSTESLKGALAGSFPDSSKWRTIPVQKPYVFYADPFFSEKPPGLLVEAVENVSGLGEIVYVSEGDVERHRSISNESGHMSYPSVAMIGDDQIVVPEVASWSRPRAFKIAKGELSEMLPLNIEGAPRIIDPTLFQWSNRLWLLGNVASVGSTALYLWSADNLRGKFRLHPKSPIVISPKGGRMAGNLVRVGPRLIRFGQDFRGAYGDGILAFEVQDLSIDNYREELVGNVRFGDRRGPHTLNIRRDAMAFDWYEDRLSLMAGVRRLMAQCRKAPEGNSP